MGECALNSFKIYSYSGRPDQILNAVELGFDVFSGSFPFILTQQNRASLYKYKMDQIASANGEEENSEVPVKRRKLTETTSSPTTEQFIDLKDQK